MPPTVFTDSKVAYTRRLPLANVVVRLLLRFVKFGSKWELSFSRPAGVVRCAVWVRRDGTASRVNKGFSDFQRTTF